MRFEIKDGKIAESFHIDAPYDCVQDALTALVQGVIKYTRFCFAPTYKTKE